MSTRREALPLTVHPPALLSVEEAARRLGGIDPDTVRELCARGELAYVAIGRRRLIRPEALAAYAADNETPVRAPRPLWRREGTDGHEAVSENRRRRTR